VDNNVYSGILAAARTEHIAIQSYLKAYRAVEEWRLIIGSTPSSDTPVDDKIDLSNLNDFEQSIAKSMEKREIILQKQKATSAIVEAAETARKDGKAVLVHEGGWLVDSDVDTGFRDSSPEGLERKNEIEELRKRMLPHAVKCMQEVCGDTAAWMWASLLAGSPALGSTPKEVLVALDDTFLSSTEGDSSPPKSPFSPRYWTHQALALAEAVSSDEFLVYQAFGAGELKEMVGKFSEIAISDLVYSV
jgi:Nuclear pore protein 84 / 107